MYTQLVKIVLVHILEVDLEYPDELHCIHNNYPLAPEKLEITYDTLSDYF